SPWLPCTLSLLTSVFSPTSTPPPPTDSDDLGFVLPPLPTFVRRILRLSRVQPHTLLVAHIYIRRLARSLKTPPAATRPDTPYRLFLAAILLASKYTSDCDLASCEDAASPPSPCTSDAAATTTSRPIPIPAPAHCPPSPAARALSPRVLHDMCGVYTCAQIAHMERVLLHGLSYNLSVHDAELAAYARSLVL
ncbi:hypothetical protein RI367_008025, partial [Sorochytrium milnesiophthora]